MAARSASAASAYWADAACWISRSTIEYEPADVVSHPLIVQNKIANGIRQLLALPLTLQATCPVPFTLDDG
jgi:hypothetical protein